MERIPVIRDIGLKVRVDRPPSRLIQLPEGRELRWRAEDGFVETAVPDMHIHTAVVIELEGG